MALEFEKHVGIRGLNLGIDPAQVVQGSLTLADGVRFVEAGAAHSRNGRVRAGLEFPSEGADIDAARVTLYGAGVTPYTQSIPHMVAPGRVRGFGTFYDQRIETRTVTNSPFIPYRVNFLYKSNGIFYFNNDFVGSGTDILTGVGTFDSAQTRAKFVQYGDRAYIVDPSTRPLLMSRRKKNDGYLAYQQVKYDVRRMGIRWPRANTDVPTVAAVAAGSNDVADGTYRFRIALENSLGVLSAPSLTAIVVHQNIGAAVENLRVTFPAIPPEFATGQPDAVTKWRVYVSYAENVVPNAATPIAVEPTEFKFWKSTAIATASVDFSQADLNKMSSFPPMPWELGSAPKLVDFITASDRGYGISAPDTIFRETPVSEGERREAGYGPQQWQGPRSTIYPQFLAIFDNTQITEISVDESFLFWSVPGDPTYLHNYVRFGSGSERGVGVATLGDSVIVFTNVSILVFDANDVRLKRSFAKVGCLSRDSIVETEQGIRFLGSDGVPRIFNGATVDEISNELLPIFDREDYTGDYLRFDRANGQECQGTFGDRKFYFTFPVSINTTLYSPGTYIDQNPQRHLAVGDASRGPTAWTIDRPGAYEIVYWLGRESRLLGIDTSGAFYFLEEGFVDQRPSPTADADVYFDMKFRKFASAAGLQGQFYRVAVDANTQGETLTVEFRVDDVPSLTYSTTFTTTRRDERKFYLPAKFKGRYLDVRIFGTVGVRVAVYGVTIELAPRGVF